MAQSIISYQYSNKNQGQITKNALGHIRHRIEVVTRAKRKSLVGKQYYFQSSLTIPGCGLGRVAPLIRYLLLKPGYSYLAVLPVSANNFQHFPILVKANFL